MSILEAFLNFFNCSGQEFSPSGDFYDEQDKEQETSSMQEIVQPANPIGSASISAPTSIYSIPSRESMTEIRQDSMNRFRRSPLFSFTSSTPMIFSFDGEEYGAEEKRDDSIRSASLRSKGQEFSSEVKRIYSIATVTTADSNSVVEGEHLHQDSSEDSLEYPIDVVAVRE